MSAWTPGSLLAVVAVLAAALAAGPGCSRDPAGASPATDAGQAGAVTLSAGGRCLWLEHHGGRKYLNLCVLRAFGAEAELTSEWRPLARPGAVDSGPAVTPDRLTHHVTEGETISRESISVTVRGLAGGRVVVERL